MNIITCNNSIEHNIIILILIEWLILGSRNGVYKSDCNCGIVPSKAYTHSVLSGCDMYYFTLCKLSNFNLPVTRG